jgi:hypothetical protein
LVDHFAIGWLRVFNAIARRNMRTSRDLERLLEGARLAPLQRVRIVGLGWLPVIHGVIAQASPYPSTDSRRSTPSCSSDH